MEGDEVSIDARADHPRQLLETVGFYAAMDRHGQWEPVPILVTMGGAGGAADHGFFVETIEKVRTSLTAAGPHDAVYLCNHGAMITTEEEAGDGIFFAAVREAVGPDVPLVATLDPHGNISDLMLNSIDVVVAYRTDPHVDQRERGEEAANLLHEVWTGMRPQMVAVKLPIVPPNVSLFTDQGPFAEIVTMGQQRLTAGICNVSILGGFAFSDTSKNGLSIIVTGRDDDTAAHELAKDLADYGWANRDRFVCEATPMKDAIERAVATGVDPSLPATIMSDLGDNCGAGGPANTVVEAKLETCLAHGAVGGLQTQELRDTVTAIRLDDCPAPTASDQAALDLFASIPKLAMDGERLTITSPNGTQLVLD